MNARPLFGALAVVVGSGAAVQIYLRTTHPNGYDNAEQL